MSQLRHRWPRSLCSLFAVAAFCGTATLRVCAAASAEVAEYDLKAALVYRTAKFVEWPSEAFAGSKSPFVICVVGDSAAFGSFRALESKTVGTRSISVRRITGDVLDLRQCHTAYFPAAGADFEIGYASDKLQGAPVLTIGDTKSFVERGGMLGLVMSGERVTFLIHLEATRRARLVVSSQLLQLSTVIDETT